MSQAASKKPEKVEETLQVIVEGKAVQGTRTIIRKPGRPMRQVIGYQGEFREDPESYAGKANEDAMLWGARLVLLKMYEETQQAVSAS